MGKQELKSGKKSNNVQINDAGRDNTFIINNGNSSNVKAFTKLEIDSESNRVFSKKQLKDSSLNGVLKLLGATIIGGIGFISDAIGLSLQLNIDYWWILLAGFAGGILVSHKDLRNLFILMKAHQNKGNAAFVGKNEVCEEDSSNGDIHIYKVSGKCIYPGCTGRVILEYTPPRERDRCTNSYVGICSICGKDHSYKVDFNLVATPEEFDWRSKKKS